MKTTLELPDELMAEAKSLALRRRTTLKALFTKALQREVRGEVNSTQQRFEVDESGWPVLRREERSMTLVTDEFVQSLRDSEGV